MNRTPTKAGRASLLAALGSVLAILASGCGGGGGTAASSTDSSPAQSLLPDSSRIDKVEPTFSAPTTITNPLFPINSLAQVVQVGSEAEGPLRQEITLLPETKTIDWNGQQIETIASQFMAYSDRRILEVATDYFAQADDGSVWYFGEDVTNYADGVVESHDGTWLAGKDGPPGMIMPADPQVGDVYRPENIPGLVFEEVVVKSIDETVDGPQGLITGCLLIEEHPMDGAIEVKTYAPGYGEFHAVVESENEIVTVSTGIPTDALTGGEPGEVTAIAAGANALIAPIQDWSAAEASLASMTGAWETVATTGVPPLTANLVDQAIQDLGAGITAQDEAATQVAAVDMAFAASDLRLLHEDAATVDRARMDLLARRALLDAAGNETGPVAGDLAALQAIWVRVRHTVADPSPVGGALDAMATAVNSDDLSAAGSAAEELMQVLAQL